jgi:hypothetical protein
MAWLLLYVAQLLTQLREADAAGLPMRIVA